MIAVVKRQDGPGTLATKPCIKPSLQIRCARHNEPNARNDESIALSNSAVAERHRLSVMDQSTVALVSPDPRDMSETELLEAAKGGDENAFEELIERCTPQVKQRIFRIVGNRQDTEDVLQESLLKAYTHLQRFRGSSRFSTWLHRIAVNTALIQLRNRKPSAVAAFESQENDSLSGKGYDLPDRSPNAEQIYIKQQATEVLSRAVKRLPPMFHGVVDEFYDGESSLQETADAIGITVAATKSRLLRARLMLRIALKRERISVHDL